MHLLPLLDRLLLKWLGQGCLAGLVEWLPAALIRRSAHKHLRHLYLPRLLIKQPRRLPSQSGNDAVSFWLSESFLELWRVHNQTDIWQKRLDVLVVSARRLQSAFGTPALLNTSRFDFGLTLVKLLMSQLLEPFPHLRPCHLISLLQKCSIHIINADWESASVLLLKLVKCFKIHLLFTK